MKEKCSQGITLMKEKCSQGITLWSLLAALLMLILSAGILVAIYFAFQRWWSGNTISNAPPPLDAAILLLTLLVAVVGIFVGLTSLSTKRDWEKFKQEQEPIIKKLQKDQDEIMWISKLKDKVLPTDPYLRKDESQEVVESITAHYDKDQDDEAWEMYGVGRFFDMKKNYKKAIEYYDIADVKSRIDSNLKLHIFQSLGIDHFQRGKQLEDDGKNGGAIEEYNLAIKFYNFAIKINELSEEAHNNKGITLIQLGKVEGNKPDRYYEEAISCLDECIKIEPDNYDHHYDKARALALLNQPDKVIESLTRAFNLAKHEKLGVLLKQIEDDIEDFRNIKELKAFKELRKRYTDIPKGNN